MSHLELNKKLIAALEDEIIILKKQLHITKRIIEINKYKDATHENL